MALTSEEAQAARDYLAARLVLRLDRVQSILASAITDAYLGGSAIAAEAVNGSVLPAMVGGTWDAWTPGWGGAAETISDPGLSAVLDRLGFTIKGLESTTIDQLGRQLAQGVANGDSMDTIAASLSDWIDNPDRAWMIADTEAARAASDASLATYDANGVTGKSWMAESDACPICQANADQGVIAVDDNFDSGDDAPPAHPRCRCALSPADLSAGDESP